MFTLKDTFNGYTISRHRTIRNALKAQHKFSAAVRRANGQNSYIPTAILDNGRPLSESQYEEMMEAELSLHTGR